MGLFKSISKIALWSLASVSVALAGLVVLAPSNSSLAKYVLEPITYNISMASYANTPLTSLAACAGVDTVGETLTGGALSPSGATATYQWQRSLDAAGPYSDISEATSSTYTLGAGDLGYYIRLSATGTGVYSGTVYSSYKGPVAPRTISTAAIAGISYPVNGATASTSLPDTSEYTASISWSPPLVDGKFGSGQIYTATVEITPKSGYTLTGIPENFFTVTGATSVTNAANSGVVTVVFPSTDLTPVTAIGTISGTPRVGETLTAGTLTPSNAKVSYQWMRSTTTSGGTYTNVSGAISSSYTLTAGDVDCFFKVTATGTDSYSGAVTSAYAGPILPKPISQAAVGGVTVPVTGVTGATAVTATSEYTGSISWNPALVDGKFQGSTVYTATITLSPKTGYTTTGVAANFFTVAGASSVTNPAGSGVITATFPSTSLTPLISIGGILGVSRVGDTLTAGALAPAGATATYQWQISQYAAGPYENIADATGSTYTLNAGEYNYYLRVAATGNGNYSGTVYSPYKGPVAPQTVTIDSIPGVAFPVTGNTAVTTITATSQFTGTVSWSPALTAGKFAGDTVYTATITLTAKSGFTMTGVAEDFFNVSGATTVANPASSGTVTAVFPSTALTPLVSIGAIGGTSEVGQLLTAGALNPEGAAVAYQWLRSVSGGEPYTEITGATSSTYTLTGADAGKYINVVATGIDPYTGAVYSTDVGPIQSKTISIAALSGISAPAAGGTAPTALSPNSQYAGTISWSPALSEGKFAGGVAYTASITVAPRTGYTLTGVSADFFTVSGATTVSNAADSGNVTAVFPVTDTIQVTAIGSISGVSQVGRTLTAGVLTPSGATVSYQWQKSLTAGGPYTDIPGATSATYDLLTTDCNYFIRLTAVGTGGYSGSVSSFYRGPVAPKTITINTFGSYSSFPTTGNAASYIIVPNDEYEGTISWSPALADGKFEANTVYTATVTLAPNPGYTVDGVPAGFFYVNGATSVTNAADSNVVTVVFPNTDRIPITAVGGVLGTARVGQILTAGPVTPSEATVGYQWQKSSTAEGYYTDIPGATSGTYTLTVGDLNSYIKVLVNGTADYSRRITSSYKGPVAASPYTLSAIAGIDMPVEDVPAATSVTETDQYTGTVSWSPALVDGKFQGSTPYTATITLTPKTGYTATGIPANFFTVPDAASVTNNENSGVITVEYPSTEQIQITAIAAIIGTERSGSTLTAGALAPSGATASYQWERSTTAYGTYTPITGATSNTYVVVPGDFDDYLRVVATGTGGYSGTVTSPYKGPVEPSKISISAIEGIPAPVTGNTAVTTITENNQFTGTVSWSPTPTGGVYQPDTIYTATITVVPKNGFTVSGVTANFFTVSGATSVTNPVNSGTVMAVFPSTALTQLTSIAGISGAEQVGKIMTAGAVTPAGATVSYQWQKSTSADGPYTNITGATSANYTVVASYYNYYIRVVATGTGSYAGSVTSPYKGPIAASPITRSTITGLTPPVMDATAVTSIPETNQYTATVSWNPEPPGGIFAGNTIYTATVTLSPKSGYTTVGIPEDYFIVSGADHVVNSADSGVVTVTFPSTAYTALTAVAAPVGVPKVANTLTAGALTPSDATVTYQWKSSTTPDGMYSDIEGATGSSYLLKTTDYNYYVKLQATGTGSFAGTVLSDAIGPVEAGPVTIADIPGLDYPVTGGTAASVITETDQYTGTVSWSPEDATFQAATVYTATIYLTPKNGYTMAGVEEDFFTVYGASSVTNPVDSGVVTAVFPSTALTPITSIVSILGIEQVGRVLVAGDLIPSNATATYQWMKSSAPDGTYSNISGATSDSYTLMAADYGSYFKVIATGSGDYSGAATSPYRGPIEPAPISIAAIDGVAPPVLNATAATSVTETDQYTGSVSWDHPLSVDGKFLGNTEYTATITLQPKFGYTAAGVAEDFFTVMGASAVDHTAGSGVVTATFPSTNLTPITAIGTITGTVMVDQTLTAGDLDPDAATVTYQWQRSLNGTDWTNIDGATASTFGLTAGDYTYYIRAVAIGTGDYSGVAYSDTVGPVAAAPINISLIQGLPVPVWKSIPGTTITATSQFTLGTITWDPYPPPGKFQRNVSYKAIITIVPKSGYTLTGVAENFFIVEGAITDTNPANSGVITATYPKTYAAPMVSIGGIGGVPRVGETLTAGALDPSDATVTYQWWRCGTPDGTYAAISGATSGSYVLTPDDYSQYLTVRAVGTGEFIGEVLSPYKGPIQPAVVSLNTISGVTPPATGATPVTSLADTSQYTLAISWSPTVSGTFAAEIIYTATITVTPKTGYTLDGVPEDFFQVAGTTFIANAAGSGVITAEFPETEAEIEGLAMDFLLPMNLLSIEAEIFPSVETTYAPELKKDPVSEPAPVEEISAEPAPEEEMILEPAPEEEMILEPAPVEEMILEPTAGEDETVSTETPEQELQDE